MSEKIHVLFVCLGNIVRSPLGENMFAHLAVEAGLSDKYAVDSAGTAAYHVGETPDRRMRQVAAEFGLNYSGSARQVRSDDFERFDVIIAMDSSNHADLLGVVADESQRAKVHMMRKFDEQSSPTAGVPDPYYGGIDGFYEVYRIVKRSCNSLLDALEAGDV